jgi:hypothetical protein
LKGRKNLEEICVNGTVVLIWVIEVCDVRIWPAVMDGNTEANVRHCEHGNVYIDFTKEKKVISPLYNQSRSNEDG